MPSDDAPFVAFFERQGCRRIETEILQPAALFLDLSGEDIRRRLFLSADADGREMCLRPEYTIPVCRRHLASGAGEAAYCYQGPVFRQRPGASGEFQQAGFELIGGPDAVAADARALALAFRALEGAGSAFAFRLGDMGLLGAVLDALAVPVGLRRRLIRDLASGSTAGEALTADAAEPKARYAGLLAAIAGQDSGAARAFIEDVMAIAGVVQVGGRSAGEIADRFLAKADGHTRALSPDARAVLLAYLAVEGRLEDAVGQIADILAAAGLPVRADLDRFAERIEAFDRHGIAGGRLTFKADFVRALDYYTGLIFEVRRSRDGPVVAAGGRYDELLGHLGSTVAVPAVGCSFWLDRLAGDAA